MADSTFPSSKEQFDNAILLATLPNLSTPHFLGPVITWATSQTKQRLIIILFSRHFNVHYPESTNKDYLTFPEIQALSRTESWDPVQRILTFTYVQATKVAQDMDKVLMSIDVLLRGINEDLDPHIGDNQEICFRVTGDSIPVPLPSSIGTLRQLYIRPGDKHSESRIMSAIGTPKLTQHVLPPLYPVTALGGTFDHLHAGHKILLSMAAYITSKKLIVGITDDSLLTSKSNPHILEPLQTRTKHVRAFLAFFKPDIQADIVPITDVYGPTGWDPDIQALVVSRETLGGAEAIKTHRAKFNLPPLHPFLIDVISATNASLDHEDADWLKEHKLSSTFIRQWIVDQAKGEGKETAKEGEGVKQQENQQEPEGTKEKLKGKTVDIQKQRQSNSEPLPSKTPTSPGPVVSN